MDVYDGVWKMKGVDVVFDVRRTERGREMLINNGMVMVRC